MLLGEIFNSVPLLHQTPSYCTLCKLFVVKPFLPFEPYFIALLSVDDIKSTIPVIFCQTSMPDKYKNGNILNKFVTSAQYKILQFDYRPLGVCIHILMYQEFLHPINEIFNPTPAGLFKGFCTMKTPPVLWMSLENASLSE